MLTHAFGAVFDNPDLVAVAVVGDGEAETGPLEGSWKGVQLPQPAARRRRPAGPPPQRLQDLRARPCSGAPATSDIGSLLAGTATTSTSSRATSRCGCTRHSRRRSTRASIDIRRDPARGAHERADRKPPRWPAIVLRTPKGWTGPKELDGVPIEGTFRAHQVPLAAVRSDPGTWRCSRAGCRATGPRSSSTQAGRLVAALARAGAHGRPADGREPPRQRRATGRLRCVVPDFDRLRDRRSERPESVHHESTRQLGRDAARHLRRATRRPSASSAPTRPTRTGSAPSSRSRTAASSSRRIPSDDHVSPDGRVMEVLSEHNCQGWLEGYVLTGPPRPLRDLRGVRARRRVDGDAARQVARDVAPSSRGARPSRRSTTCSPRPAGATTTTASATRAPASWTRSCPRRGRSRAIYLPPDANCLLSVADHCLRSHDYVNLIIIDKQPQLQWLDMEAARAHCAAGASVWAWAGTETPDDEAGRRPRVRGRHGDARDPRGRGVAARSTRRSFACASSTSST